MALRFITYRVRSDKVDENQKLIEAVFDELHATSPAGVRYFVLKLEDGSFCHLVDDDAGVLSGLDAFKAFQLEGKERRMDEPQRRGARVVGDYQMIADGNKSTS